MIRGALILATGFILGYSKGIQENVAALEKIDELATRFSSYMEESERKVAEEKQTEDQLDLAVELRRDDPTYNENPREGEDVS